MQKPSKFLCLILKMLQIQPEKEIVYEFIKNADYKYVSALGCFYLRLLGRQEEIYECLEPLYNDYRKLRYRQRDGKYTIIRMDEFIDELLTRETSCEVVLPRISKRQLLEETGTLKPRSSALEDLDEDDEALIEESKENGDNAESKEDGENPEDQKEDGENPRAEVLKEDGNDKERSGKAKSESKSSSRSRSRSKSRDRKKKHKKHSKKKRHHRSKSRSRSRSSRSKSESRSRSRSRSRGKKEKKKNWKSRLKEKRRDENEREKDKTRDKQRDKEDDKEKNGADNVDKGDNKAEGKVAEFSVEYWNEIRANLGLKPLPPK